MATNKDASFIVSRRQIKFVLQVSYWLMEVTLIARDLNIANVLYYMMQIPGFLSGFSVLKGREVRSRRKVPFQTTLYWTQQWKASEPLVTDEEPLAHQPALCYANSSALYAENDPFLPFLNKIDFILSFYCRLSCLWKAVIWQCLMVRVCLCAPEEEAGVFCLWIPELCEKDRFLWGWI